MANIIKIPDSLFPLKEDFVASMRQELGDDVQFIKYSDILFTFRCYRDKLQKLPPTKLSWRERIGAFITGEVDNGYT